MYLHFKLNDELTLKYESKRVFFAAALLIILTIVLPLLAIITAPLFLTSMVMVAMERIHLGEIEESVF
ncbi:hypothetical protein OAJ94_01080 [Deltaproteobacteria bacterium]|nr:hypothetical protein [Deltaproteobacteria bacterium]